MLYALSPVYASTCGMMGTVTLRLGPKLDPQFSSRQSVAKKPALKPFQSVSFCGSTAESTAKNGIVTQ